MIPDASHAPRQGYVWVRTLDGSYPDPNFEKKMTYTVAEKPKE
jgi:hypothetical protein